MSHRAGPSIRTVHIENHGSEGCSTTSVLKFQRLATIVGSTWQPSSLSALHSSAVDFESCQFGRFTGKNLAHGCVQAWLFDPSPAIFRSISTFEMLAVTAAKNTVSTLAEGIEFANPNFSQKKMRQWKSEQLSRFLATPGRWKDIRQFLPRSAGRTDVVRPHENDFACMLATLFKGPFEVPTPAVIFSEPLWTMNELTDAIRRLKNDKGGDEVGLTAEVLKHAPREFLDALLRLYNDVIYTGEPPVSWSKTLFTMLPKKVRAKQTTDFRPIANVRLLYKTFAYLLLGRLEHVLDAEQPEEQHGFRAGRRLEEHLLSANILWDKAETTGLPVWSISLDLSKAFDRVHWPALWAALFEQGVPEHLIWVLQQVYYGQHGEIVGDFGRSDQFPITGGVRQGCVLSP